MRFHPPITGAIARALASAYGAGAGGWDGYRAAENWASRGVTVAGVGIAVLLLALSFRAMRARWFRWLGWLPALAMLLAGMGCMLGAAGVGAAHALERCQSHPSLPGCQVSDKPPGPDSAVTKSEPEWILVTGGAALALGGVGGFIGAGVLGAAWLASLGIGAASLLRRRAPQP
ncbi:Hypothetical protein A7982_11667 [Minicystis rosea]|nr:Hypothetical protein A7982_11667 [Minicystis rosea]